MGLLGGWKEVEQDMCVCWGGVGWGRGGVAETNDSQLPRFANDTKAEWEREKCPRQHIAHAGVSWRTIKGP